MSEIAFTKVALPYGWLGNMSPHPVTLDGVAYRSAEAAFQCLRFPAGHPARAAIMAAKSPFAAKLVAKQFATEIAVEPCSQQDVDNMERVLRAKLADNPELAAELRATGTVLIVEDCTARQRGSGLFWGAARHGAGWRGANVLGHLWMMLRSELQANSDSTSSTVWKRSP